MGEVCERDLHVPREMGHELPAGGAPPLLGQAARLQSRAPGPQHQRRVLVLRRNGMRANCREGRRGELLEPDHEPAGGGPDQIRGRLQSHHPPRVWAHARAHPRAPAPRCKAPHQLQHGRGLQALQGNGLDQAKGRRAGDELPRV